MFDMDHLAPSFLLAIFLLSPGMVAQPPSQQADLILRHGVVLTVDAADSIAEAIAIRDGRIIAVGQDEAVSRLAGPEHV